MGLTRIGPTEAMTMISFWAEIILKCVVPEIHNSVSSLKAIASPERLRLAYWDEAMFEVPESLFDNA